MMIDIYSTSPYNKISVKIGDTVIFHDTEDLTDYKLIVEKSEYESNCALCVFGYEEELYDFKCPCDDCHVIGIHFKLVSSERVGVNMNRHIRVSEIAKKVCNPDVCMYYKIDMSCRESSSPCLLNIIAK